ALGDESPISPEYVVGDESSMNSDRAPTLRRCDTHGLTFDSAVHSGCVLCRGKTPNRRARGVRWSRVLVGLMLCGPLVAMAWHWSRYAAQGNIDARGAREAPVVSDAFPSAAARKAEAGSAVVARDGEPSAETAGVVVTRLGEGDAKTAATSAQHR